VSFCQALNTWRPVILMKQGNMTWLFLSLSFWRSEVEGNLECTSCLFCDCPMLQHEIRASLGALLDLQCYELIGAILSASACNCRCLINVFMRLGYSLNLQLRKPRTCRLHKVVSLDLGSPHRGQSQWTFCWLFVDWIIPYLLKSSLSFRN